MSLAKYEAWKQKREERSEKNALSEAKTNLQKYDEYAAKRDVETGVAEEKLHDAQNSYNSLLNDYYKTANGRLVGRDVYSYNPESALWLEESDKAVSLIKDASNTYRQLLERYSPYISDVDQIYAGLDSDAKSYGDIAEVYKGQSDFYGSFADEGAFLGALLKDGTEEGLGGRKAAYARVSALYDDAVKRGDKEAKRTYGDMMRAYERIYKTGDEYTEYREENDFSRIAANRDFVNPTMRDFVAYESAVATTRPGEKEPDAPVVVDPLGLFLNTDEKIKESAAGTPVSHEDGFSKAIKDGYDGSYDQLTDGEIEIYYYLFNAQGRDAAIKYLSDMRTELNKRSTEQREEVIKNSTGLGRVALSVVSVPLNIIGGMTAFVSDAVNTMAGKPINPYDTAHSWQNDAAAIRFYTAKDIDDFTKNANLLGISLGDTYQALMSGADSIVGGMTIGPTGYGAAMFAGASSAKAKELFESGASDAEIKFVAGLTGVFEGLFEKISLDLLFKPQNSVYVKDILKKALAQGGIEASEEALTEMAGMLTEMAALDKNIPVSEMVQRVWEAAAGGFISGVTIGGGVGVSQYLSQNAGAKKAYGAQANAIAKEASMLDPQSRTASRINKKAAKGKDLSGADIRKSLDVIEKSVHKGDFDSIKKAVEDRLEVLSEKGDTKKIASALAKRIYNAYAKQSNEYNDHTVNDLAKKVLTPSEVKALKKSTFGKRVENELNPENIRSGEYTTEWTEKIGTKMINEPEYGAENRKLGITGRYHYQKDGMQASGVKEVVSKKGDEAVVLLENGQKVNASEAVFKSENEALVYEGLVNAGYSVPAINAIARTYDGKTGATAFLLGVREQYEYGALGFSQKDSDGVFSKDLDEVTKRTAFEAGRIDKNTEVKEQQEHIDRRVMQALETGKEKTKGTVIYNGNRSALSKRQKASLKALEELSRSLGVRFMVYDSKKVGDIYYMTDKYGNVLLDEDGKKAIAPNGMYDPKTKTVYIDVNAGNKGEGAILFTAAHELTHLIKEWSPAKYEVFKRFLLEKYAEKGKSVDKLVNDKIKNSRKSLSYEEALDEVVADSCESFLLDSQAIAELKQKDESLWKKIKEEITKLIDRIKQLYKEISPNSEEGKIVRGWMDEANELRAMWVDALADAGESYSSIGIELDSSSASVAPFFSERTWTASEYVKSKNEMASKLSEALGVSRTKAARYIDDVNSIAKIIAEDRARLDYEASSFGSAFVSNVEYGGSFDYTTLCKKRRLFTGTFSEIQKRLRNVALTPDDILKIRNLLIENGQEATCGLCYVEGSRANMGKFAKEFIRLYKKYNPDGWTPDMADVNTPDGVEQMRINHPEVYEQYEYFWNHYGKLKDSDPALFASQQKPKLYEARKEYKGEILEAFKNDKTVEKKNRNGGIRMQSFSDFEIVHLIDTMQVIMDMSTVGLAGQAYTKVPEFARAFGSTGLKINLSLIAKGVDENGRLIFDDREGMPHQTAFSLRNRFSKNVGTIIVTFTDEQLMAAMADERIDFIIPFHRSQWKKGQYSAMGLPKGTKDYTFMQNEKLIKPTYHEYRGRMVKDKATNLMPNAYWKFSKSGKENAELYLKMCAESNRRPKFYKLLENNGDGSYSLKKDGSTDGYWKLLIDFKMYDNEGKGSPQMAVRPEFEMTDATDMLREYKGGHSSYPVSYAVVDQFVSEYQELAEVAKRATLQERSASLGQRGLREQEIVDYLEKASPKTAEKYKNDLAELEKQKSVLADLKKQISKGKTTALQDEQIKTQNRISLLERRTAKAESSARLVMEKRTSLAKARDRAKMQDKKSALKKQIRESVKRLNTLLNKGTKEKHVKSGQQDLVSSALALAKVFFGDVVLNEDLVRYVDLVEVSERESRLLAEYKDLLDKRDTIKEEIDALEQDPSLTKEEYLQLDNLKKELEKAKKSVGSKSAQLKEVFERARAAYNKKTAKSLVEDLQREYKKLKDSEDDFISNAYSEEVYERLEVFKNNLGETSVRSMNEGQLSEVLDAFKMIEHSLKKANALFREGKAESLEEWLKETRSQIVENGKEGKDMPKFLKVSSDVGAGFFWNELKPYYAVERTGSDRIRTLFWDVIEGEQRASSIEKQARDFLRESKKKHNITKKVLEQTKTFTLPDGKTFTLKVSDMMSIYAYSKREQAYPHMLQGGFVFGNDNTYKKTADFIKKRTKKLSDEKVKEFLENVTALEYTRAVHQTPYVPGEDLLKMIVGEISGNADYKGFADDLQNFMTDLGQLGNETSNKLYGVDLFKEKFYIPLRSAKDYLNHVAMEMGDTVTSATITNMGMTKQTVPDANNPIVLESLDQLFADHVSQMASYASLAVPVDNMRRVLTFKSNAQKDAKATSMLALMESYMGSGAKKYFEQYLKDVNGNAVKATGYTNPLMGLFGRAKKVQVAANLSVAIQQPSSILRATAVIKPKYLLSSLGNVRMKSTWEELQKYAPIAITKEIGGFDVGSNGSGKRYILSDEYDTLKDKAKAFFKDSDYRDDLYMSLATLGDEYGWGVIWNAVKKEAADTTSLEVGSKDYFEHCKKRFTEIIVKTQVYDSINARSGMMRSQNDAVKFATSFMGEPTVTVNMLMDSATKLQRADETEKKQAGKAFAATVASVITSALVNNALKSVIYAMRDEDEDETLAEKYLQALGKNIRSDINPLNWLPIARDLVSIAEGWSVDRPDMSLLGEVVTDSTDIVSKMMKDEDVTMEDILNLAGTFGNFAGIPAENAIKDVKAIANTVIRMFDDINQTDLEDAWGYFYKGLSGKEFSENEMLYDALRDGDEERIDYYKRDFEERDVSFETKVKSAIKKQYVSGKISKDQAKADLSSYLGYDPKKDEDEIFWIIREWDYSKTKKKDDEDYEKYADFYSAVKSGKDLKKTIKFYTDHGVEKQTLASNITREFKPLYKEMTNKERAAIKGYLLNAYVVLGYDRDKKSKDIDGWLNEDED